MKLFKILLQALRLNLPVYVSKKKLKLSPRQRHFAQAYHKQNYHQMHYILTRIKDD